MSILLWFYEYMSFRACFFVHMCVPSALGGQKGMLFPGTGVTGPQVSLVDIGNQPRSLTRAASTLNCWSIINSFLKEIVFELDTTWMWWHMHPSTLRLRQEDKMFRTGWLNYTSGFQASLDHIRKPCFCWFKEKLNTKTSSLVSLLIIFLRYLTKTT